MILMRIGMAILEKRNFTYKVNLVSLFSIKVLLEIVLKEKRR
jgi:hypothetical protein